MTKLIYCIFISAIDAHQSSLEVILSHWFALWREITGWNDECFVFIKRISKSTETNRPFSSNRSFYHIPTSLSFQIIYKKTKYDIFAWPFPQGVLIRKFSSDWFRYLCCFVPEFRLCISRLFSGVIHVLKCCIQRRSGNSVIEMVTWSMQKVRKRIITRKDWRKYSVLKSLICSS